MAALPRAWRERGAAPLVVATVVVLAGPLVLRRVPAESQLARWLLDGLAAALAAVPYVVAAGLASVLVVGFLLGVTAPLLATLDGPDEEGGGQPVLDPERPRLWAAYVASRRGLRPTWQMVRVADPVWWSAALVTLGVAVRSLLLRLFVLQPSEAATVTVTVVPPVGGDTLTLEVDDGERWWLPVEGLRPDDVAALERWAGTGEALSLTARRRDLLLSSAVLSSSASSVTVLGRWPAVVPVEPAPPDVD